jgi:thiamine-phosphate pyrophosphorylase
MSTASLPPALLALTPGEGARGLTERVARAASGGLRGVVLREGSLEDGEYLALARGLARALAPWPDAWLCLHDRPHLAQAAGAAAVHLGGRSLSPEQVRGWLDARVALGFSSHAGDSPQRLRGADYLLHAPYAAVADKGPPLGPAGIAAAVRDLGLPLWALGGVTPDEVGAALAAGARGVAVLRGLWSGDDPALAARAYLDAIARHSASMRP